MGSGCIHLLGLPQTDPKLVLHKSSVLLQVLEVRVRDQGVDGATFPLKVLEKDPWSRLLLEFLAVMQMTATHPCLHMEFSLDEAGILISPFYEHRSFEIGPTLMASF